MRRYSAFISYSHGIDGDIAPALESALQRLARPWNGRRAMEVFLDSNDLSASPHLWSSIVVSLDASEWFVLLASPGSAGSKWVGQEISHWLSDSDRHERFLIVLTSGRMQWSDGDFTDDSDAVHPALRGLLSEEPHYVDMTQVDRSIALDLRNPLFKERVATVASAIRGISVGDLIGEDTRQFRLARRLRRIAVVSLAALTVGALVASVVAFQQRSEAIAQTAAAKQATAAAESAKREADDNAAQSRSRELAALALNTMAEDPVVAMLVAVEANYPGDAEVPIDVAEAHTTLGVALRQVQGTTVLKVGPRITAPTTDLLQADDEYLVGFDLAKGTRTADDALLPPTWWNTETGDEAPAPVSDEVVERMMARFGAVKAAGSAISTTPISVGTTPVGEPLAVSDDFAVVVGLDDASGDLVAESLIDGSVLGRFDVPQGEAIFGVAMLSPDAVVFSGLGGRVMVWEFATGPAREVQTEMVAGEVWAIDDHTILASGNGTYVGADGSIVTDFGAPQLRIIDVTRPWPASFIGSIDAPPSLIVRSFVPSPDGALLAAITDDDGVGQPVVVWDVASGEQVASIDTAQVSDVRWVDPTTIAVASPRGVEQFRLRLDVGVTTGEFAAASVAGDRLALREFKRSTIAVVDGPLARSGLSSGPVASGAVDSASPGSISLSPDGSAIASLEYEQAPDGFFTQPTGVTVRSTSGRRVLAEFSDARGVAFDATGAILAVGAKDSILIVDTADWTVARTITVEGYTPEQLLWADGGRVLVVHGIEQGLGFDRHLDVVDVDTGQILATGSGGVVGMALSVDGSLLALGLQGGEVRLLRAPTIGTSDLEPLGVMVADAVEVRGLAFSPDGARLVTSGVRTTTVWDIREPRSPRPVQVVSDLPAWRFGGVFVPDIVGEARTAKGAWGVVQFRPDGSAFVLAGGSGAVDLPDFDPAFACRQADDAALERFERLLGKPSACLRVPELRN